MQKMPPGNSIYKTAFSVDIFAQEMNAQVCPVRTDRMGDIDH
jgi:hypothetical protein